MRKATLRRNGKKMMTVQVTHVMDEQDLVAVISRVLEYEAPEKDKDISRKQIENEMMEVLSRNTESALEYWGDNFSIQGIEEVGKRARTILYRTFPSFIPEENS